MQPENVCTYRASLYASWISPQRCKRRDRLDDRAIAKTDTYQQVRKDRKKVEMLFAHLKHIMTLDRLRLQGAKAEFLMAAAAQKFRRIPK